MSGPPPLVLIIQLADDAAAETAIASLRKQGWRVQVVAADLDAAPPPALGPMDVLGPPDIDAIYAAANSWQKAMPSVRLAGGQTLYDIRPWPEAPPVVWAWLNRLYPYVHVHVRLIELMHVAARRWAPAAWAVVGDDSTFPWRRGLVERSLRHFCAEAQELTGRPPVAAPEPLSPAVIEPAVARRRRHPVVATARWLWRRLRRRPRAPVSPGLQMPGTMIAGPADCVLVMRGRRGSQWHYCRQRGAWGVRDEYIENVPEALIEACRATGKTLAIVYHGEPPDTDSERRGYGQRHPGVVQELATGPLSDFFRVQRRAIAKRIPTRFHDCYLSDPAFIGAFSHRGVAYWEFLRPYAEENIPRLVLAMLTQHAGWSALFGGLAPKVVIGGRMEAVPGITQAAHHAGARVVSVKLGVGQEMLPSILAIRPDGSCADEALPDALAVWGETQAKFIRTHVPQYRGTVMATGRARSDTFTADSCPRSEVRAQLGIPDDARLILYAATARTRYACWPDAPHGASCMSLRGFAAGLRALAGAAGDDTWVLVKPHPADDLDAVVAAVAECGRSRVTLLPPGGAIHNADVLGAADVLVSSLSSIFAEAVMQDCPAVDLWLPEVNFLYEEDRCRLYGRIAVTVRAEDELRQAVRRLLVDPEARARELNRAKAALGDILGAMDGGNAARIAALVLDEAEGVSRSTSATC